MRKILMGAGGILGFLVLRRYSTLRQSSSLLSENFSSLGGRVFDTPIGKRYGFTINVEKLMERYRPFMEFVRIPGRDWEMGRYEVTQNQWREVMGAESWKGQHYVKEGDDYPVTYVSWDECQDFVEKMNERKERWNYRLPTSDEWEYACRAGSTTKYYFGDDKSKLGDYAWYEDNADFVGEEYAHEVGQKIPNDWGLYDMSGNVWEWTETINGLFLVNCGGSWLNDAGRCDSSCSARNKSGGSYNNLGVRLVRERYRVGEKR